MARLWKFRSDKTRPLCASLIASRFLIAYALHFSPTGFAEVQSTVSITSPAPSPGQSGSFSVSQSNGPAASVSGTTLDTYAGVRRFVLSNDGAGRYSGLHGVERFGVLFDQFQMFQNFLSANHFTVVSASTTCPGTTPTYTWLLTRMRPSDALRGAMSATSTSARVGGVAVYDAGAGADFTGASYFDLAGPTLTTTSYTMDRLTSGCTSGKMIIDSDAGNTWDSYATVFFGDENLVFVGEGGNPLVGVAAPQVTLQASDFSALSTEVLSGLYTAYDARTSQTRYNVFLYPDGSGTTFTLRRSTNVNDPTSYASLGTLACTSLNSPANGFCSGTLTLDGQGGGAGNVVCQLSSPGTRTMLACAAQEQGSLSTFVSIVAVTTPQAVVAVMPAGVVVASELNPSTPPTTLLTVQNMTGKSVPTTGAPSISGDRPQAPFAYAGGTFPGTNGDCGTSIAGYDSCQIEISYSPTSYATVAQTMRIEYDNGSSTVQATGNQVGTVGITSVTITPTATAYDTGEVQQFTATANYTGGGSEDVSNMVTWNSSTGGVVSFSSTGVATFTGVGTTNISATLSSHTSNIVSVTTTQGSSSVDSSGSVAATESNPSRKVFYDVVNSRYWAFYYNGTAIEYAYSTDGTTYTSAGTLSYDTSRFHVAYKNISSTAYVFVVVEADSYDIVLRRGTAGSSLISFDSAITVFDGSSTSDVYTAPTLAITTGNDLWVASRKDTGPRFADRYQAFTRKASNPANGNLSAWGTATAVGRRVNSLSSLSLVPMTGSEAMLVVEGSKPHLMAYSFNGTSWGPANTGGEKVWFEFGEGINSNVNALMRDGTNLYVGGAFLNAGGNQYADYIARWDGSNWHALGNVALNNSVLSIVQQGSNIYVAGDFTSIGGNASCNKFARFNGASWDCLGTSGLASVISLATDGTNIFLGGLFSNAGGNANADNIARFDGTTFYALDSGLSAYVNALAHDGTNLYAGGDFTDAGGNTNADRVAIWDGAAWSPMATGVTSTVSTMHLNGSTLYIGGSFSNAGGNANADAIARWTGSAWEAVTASSLSIQVRGIHVVSSSDIYITGSFTNAGGNANADAVARLNGGVWEALGTGADDLGRAIISDGAGGIYVGGAFNTIGDQESANHLARWNGSAWSSVTLASLITAPVMAIAVSGSNIYIGGDFVNANGDASADHIIRWDGSTFHAMGTGLNDLVSAIVVKGTDVYAGGQFLNAGGNTNADYFAKWDGAAWSAASATVLSSYVTTLAADDDYVYLGGFFTNVGGNASMDGVARLSGTTYLDMGTVTGAINAMMVLGSNVFLAGGFTDAGGNTQADRVARWDGTTWHSLGASGPNLSARTIATDGTNVFFGGDFYDVGGNTSADYVARWDGSTWYAVGTGLTANVWALHHDGTQLWAGGTFTNFGGNASADRIARLNGSTWEAVGTGFDSSVNVISSDGGVVYAGGDFGMSGNGDTAMPFFAMYAPAISFTPPATAMHSVIGDSNGDTHVFYRNDNNVPAYRKRSSGTWGSATALGATAPASVALAGSSDGTNLYAAWMEGDSVKYKRYQNGSGWDGAATSVASAGTNRALACTAELSSGTGVLLWTRGTSSYEVRAFEFP